MPDFFADEEAGAGDAGIIAMKSNLRALIVTAAALAVGVWPPLTAQESDRPTLSWEALAPSGERPADSPLFEEVAPAASGIVFENRYDHPQRWLELWHQYFLGTIGTGLAVGDVNGDGLADIFAAGKDSPNALFLNRGDFRFEDATEAKGLAGAGAIGAGCAMVDINNNGHLDIYVTYVGSPNELYLNDGQGNFREAAAEFGLDIDTGSNAPSFADYDRDGDLDLYLQCNFLQRSGLAEGMPDLLLENRDGRFVDVTAESGIEGSGQGHAAIWWDFDEDGWPDLYVANDFEPADKLYRNNGDGTFTDVLGEVLVAAPYSAMGADLGDFNNDGHVDFMVSEMATHDHVKHHRTVGSIATKLLWAGLDTAPQYMKNMVSLKIGPNQFAEVAYLTGLDATDWTWATRFADLDNDGRLDAFFANGMARAFHDGDIGIRSKQAQTGLQRMAYFKNSPRYDEKNLAYRNLGDYEFIDVSDEWGLGKVGISFAAAFGDFDGDGALDMVMNNMGENLTLYRNRSAEGARVVVELEGVESNRFGVGAKLKLFAGDEIQGREVSLTRGYLSTDEPIVHFGLGEAERVDRLELHWPSGAFQSFEDLEVNRRYRIREENDGSRPREAEPSLFVASEIEVPEETVSREERFQMFPMQMLIPAVETREGPELLVADVNEDGWPDVLLGGATGQATRVFLNREGRRLQWVESDDLEDDYDSEDRGLALFDFDGDGALDLFVSSGGIELDEGDDFYEDRLYKNVGDGEFERFFRGFRAEAKASGPAVAIDYNGSGELDLIVAGGTVRNMYPKHEDNVVWRRKGANLVLDTESAFAQAFARSGNTTDLLAVDWDGDGERDLVQTVQWGSPILWRNVEGTLRRDDAAIDGTALQGMWRSVAAGDFDGDGRVDLVLGNYGLNTKYKPSVAEPVRLYAPGNEYLANTYIEAYFQGDRLLPMENRELHDIQFPGLMEQTSRSISEFAEMTVQEIFPEKLLSQYEVYEMTEARSVILFQREPGAFTAEPLPRWAQSGIARDLLAADVNEDGALDLVIAHEMHPPKMWAERWLKGHVSVLLNQGDGRFEALLPWRSGVEAIGYPKNLAWADLDGDGRGELLVAMNEGPLRVYRLRKQR